MARHSVNRGLHGFQHVSFLHPAPQAPIGCSQSSTTMKLSAGQASAEFALPSRRSTTGRATNSLYQFERRLPGLHDMMMRPSAKRKWSILHSEVEQLLKYPHLHSLIFNADPQNEKSNPIAFAKSPPS